MQATREHALKSLPTSGYASSGPSAKLEPFVFERREPGPHDVLIDILYCGVCHSDIHQTRDEWGGSIFPMVPGHEIVGRVAKVGDEVEKWKIGDTVGVGCFVDSCRECEACRAGEEQYCQRRPTVTYNGYERDGKTPTYGGYSARITVDENYVLQIPDSIPLERAAPLLCAGITTYSPLRYFQVSPGDDIAVVGLGGLGHMGVKLAKAMGANVTVLSHSPGKREDALRLGADDFIATGEANAFEENAGRFDFILDTVSAKHDYNAYLNLLRRDGTMVLVGAPDPTPLSAFALISGRRRIAGSAIGGIRETQEMLDFCAEQGVASDVEVIPIQQINQAFERAIKSDVRYRFVIDIASLNLSAKEGPTVGGLG
jgi:alcohol dehydrogenase (NADP+)